MNIEPIFPQKEFNNKLYQLFFKNIRINNQQIEQQVLVGKNQEQPISIHQPYLNGNIMIIFRVIAFLILTYRFSLQKYTSFFLILVYLTEVGFNLTWIYFNLVCFDFILSKIIKSSICPKLGSWINLLYEIAFCYQFPITIIYWFLLFDYNAQHTISQIVKDIGVHGFPCFCLTFDFIFNVYIFPLKHLVLIIGFGIVYITINIGYSLAIAPVYKPLDWVSFMSYIWIIACLLIILVIHRLANLIWLNYKKQKIEAIRINSDQSLSRNQS